MPILLTDEDAIIEDESKIMGEVGHFYKKLYMSKGSSPDTLTARDELLSYVSTSVMEEQQLKIEAIPTGEEVRSILKKLPKLKAPRIDGMTMEVLLAYWSFLQTDCLAMIHQF